MRPPKHAGRAAAERNQRKTSRITLLIAVAALIGASYTVWGQQAANDRADEKQQKGAEVAGPVDQLCQRGDQLAAELRQRGACDAARNLLQAPAPPPAPAPASRAEIADAVAAYCSARSDCAGHGPTVEQVTVAVATYLAAHPPKPGRAPTPAEIASAVAAYLNEHPPPAGADGRPPTTDEIASAVNAYMAEHPAPSGPQGAQGAPGPTCPDGYELRAVVAVAPDGGTYTDALACVRPDSSRAPSPPATTTTSSTSDGVRLPIG